MIEKCGKSPLKLVQESKAEELISALSGAEVRTITVVANALMSHDFYCLPVAADLLALLPDQVRSEITVMLAQDDRMRRITAGEEDFVLAHLKLKLLGLDENAFAQNFYDSDEHQLTIPTETNVQKPARLSAVLSFMSSEQAAPCLSALKSADCKMYDEIKSHIFRFEDIMQIEPARLRHIFGGIMNSLPRFIPAALQDTSPDVKELFCKSLGTDREKNMRTRLKKNVRYSEREVQEARRKLLLALHVRRF